MEEGPSNCVNSCGNCVWPLTVCVIASLLLYFAWQSERLTPEGWRPEALLLTGRGLLKDPLVHLPAWATLSHCWSSSGWEGEWEAAAFSRGRSAAVLECAVSQRNTDTRGPVALAAAGRSVSSHPRHLSEAAALTSGLTRNQITAPLDCSHTM